MKKASQYQLHIEIRLKKVSPAHTGKALGVLLKKHLTPRQVFFSAERKNSTKTSKKAEKIINQFLARSSPWARGSDEIPLQTETVLLDDEKVYELAKQWESPGIAEYIVVVPHIFYMPLLQCAFQNFYANALDIRKHLCIFFDYAILEGMPEIIKQCFFKERSRVLKYVEREKLFFIDPGRQMFLENLISLACYIVPARYLVFIDDDFFINSKASIEQMLEPLKQGYLMSGRYAKNMDRLHTCFFAIKPESLRDNLLLFDNGRNYYADEFIDTGTITYRELSKSDEGVFSLKDYYDEDVALGHHLCHCATEMWVDFPQILSKSFQMEMLTGKIDRDMLDLSILMEALALVFHVSNQADEYKPVDNELRQKAATGSDFSAYFQKVYNNYHWLTSHAVSAGKLF